MHNWKVRADKGRCCCFGPRYAEAAVGLSTPRVSAVTGDSVGEEHHLGAAADPSLHVRAGVAAARGWPRIEPLLPRDTLTNRCTSVRHCRRVRALLCRDRAINNGVQQFPTVARRLFAPLSALRERGTRAGAAARPPPGPGLGRPSTLTGRAARTDRPAGRLPRPALTCRDLP